MLKKIGIPLLIVILGVGAFFFYSRAQKAKLEAAAATIVKTAKLETGVLDSTISATGNVRSRQQVELVWAAAGIVDEVPVKLGDTVNAGDRLATLAQSSLAQSVILAQSDLFTAQESLDKLYTTAEDSRIQAMKDISTYEQAVRDAQYQLDNFTIPSAQKNMDTVEAVALMKERLDKARLAFEPYKYYPSTDDTREDLLKLLNEAQADYDSALKRLNYEYELDVAQSNLTKAQTDYQTWKEGPNPAEVDAVKAKIAAAEAALRQSWIEAPFTGVITRLDPKAGDKVTANQSAFRIDDLSALYVDVSVSEVDIDMVQVGQPATISFDGLRGRSFDGKVAEVAPVSQGGDSTVNFTVTIQLEKPESTVRPGMTAEVEIVVERKEAALLIPNEAVRTENGKQVVYVLRADEKSVPVEITIGASSDTYSELVSGDLKPGDLVVLNPTAAADSEQGPSFMFGGGGPPRERRSNDSGGNPPPGPQP